MSIKDLWNNLTLKHPLTAGTVGDPYELSLQKIMRRFEDADQNINTYYEFIYAISKTLDPNKTLSLPLGNHLHNLTTQALIIRLKMEERDFYNREIDYSNRLEDELPPVSNEEAHHIWRALIYATANAIEPIATDLQYHQNLLALYRSDEHRMLCAFVQKNTVALKAQLLNCINLPVFKNFTEKIKQAGELTMLQLRVTDLSPEILMEAEPIKVGGYINLGKRNKIPWHNYRQLLVIIMHEATHVVSHAKDEQSYKNSNLLEDICKAGGGKIHQLYYAVCAAERAARSGHQFWQLLQQGKINSEQDIKDYLGQNITRRGLPILGFAKIWGAAEQQEQIELLAFLFPDLKPAEANPATALPTCIVLK